MYYSVYEYNQVVLIVCISLTLSCHLSLVKIIGYYSFLWIWYHSSCLMTKAFVKSTNMLRDIFCSKHFSYICHKKIMSMVPWFAQNPHSASGRKSSARINSLLRTMWANTFLAWREVRSCVSSVSFLEDKGIMPVSRDLQVFPSVSYDCVDNLDKFLTSSFNFWMQSIFTGRLCCEAKITFLTSSGFGHLHIQWWVGLWSMLSTACCSTVDGSLSCVARSHIRQDHASLWLFYCTGLFTVSHPNSSHIFA